MGRQNNRLSDRRVRTAKAGMYPDGHGLYLRVTTNKDNLINRYWIFRYASRQTGKDRQLGLGPLDTVSLADAREMARLCREQLRNGVDPIEHRKAQRAATALAAAKAITFQQCGEAYVVAHETAWRNQRHRKQWRNTLATYVYPVFGSLPVQAIDTGLVLKVLEPLWQTRPVTAGRLRGRIESVLDWAKVRGYRDGDNPARWKGHLKETLPNWKKVRAKRHHPALHYTEIGAFLVELRKFNSTPALAFEFLVLTAARTGEVVGATWPEINFAFKVWTVPADRIKAGREHRVPLSDRAIVILQDMRALATGAHVFPGDRPGQPLGKMVFFNLLQRMDRGHLTAHGFRATFRTWGGEWTPPEQDIIEAAKRGEIIGGFPREVIEAALAHALGDETEQAYQRGDLFEKRRRLMDTWAEYCGNPPAADNVVPLRREVPG